MKKLIIFSLLFVFSLVSNGQTTLTSSQINSIYQENFATTKVNHVTVHDPSIVIAYKHGTSWTDEALGAEDKMYYIFGSHMAWAKSKDMINWSNFTNNINSNYSTLFQKEAKYSALGSSSYDLSGNLWAPDVIYNKELKKWCMYMSVNGDKWYSSIVMLTADNPGATWTYAGPVVFSLGNVNASQISEHTDFYDVCGSTESIDRYKQNRNGIMTYQLNCIDPCVTYTTDGKLVMTYGSWFGGLYLLYLDPKTGFRDKTITYTTTDGTVAGAKQDKYFGIHLAGGNQNSGEASYVEKIGDKYRLFVTLGGLDAKGGYNMRVYSSENIQGPYLDNEGHDARFDGVNNVGTINGNYGSRLMSYYKFDIMQKGNTAQGHNSAVVDDDGNAYLVYHTRFDDGTEGHQVRVHQLFTNKEGNILCAPFEYRGSDISQKTFSKQEVAGSYGIIYHDLGSDYAKLETKKEQIITLSEDGTISGAYSGSWTLDNQNITLVINNQTFSGITLSQAIEELDYKTISFTAMCKNRSLWGYKKYTSDCILDPQSSIVYNVKKGINLTLNAGQTINFTQKAAYNTTVKIEPLSNAIDKDGLVGRFTEAKVRLTFVNQDYSYSTIQSFPINTSTYPHVILDSFETIEDFNNSSSNLSINQYTGLAISFNISNLTSDWDVLARSLDDKYLMHLSVLDYNASKIFEMNATSSNGGSWDSYVNQNCIATISFNPDGSISYWKDGKLLLKYTASCSANEGSATPKDVVKAVLDYYKNNKLVFEFANVSNIKVGYSCMFDASDYKEFAGEDTPRDLSAFEYFADYDQKGEISQWTGGATRALKEDASLKNYFAAVYNGSGDRGNYLNFNTSLADDYTVSFYYKGQNGNQKDRSNAQICILNTKKDDNNVKAASDCVFMLRTNTYDGVEASRTQWYINGYINEDKDNFIVIPASSWVKITCTVKSNEVTYSIFDVTNNKSIASGKYTSTNTKLNGLSILSPRNGSDVCVDNILVYKNDADIPDLTAKTQYEIDLEEYLKSASAYASSHKYLNETEISNQSSLPVQKPTDFEIEDPENPENPEDPTINDNPTGISDNDLSSKVEVYACNKIIYIKNAANQKVRIFNLNSQEVFSDIITSDYQTINFKQGLYIVVINDRAYKIIL